MVCDNSFGPVELVRGRLEQSFVVAGLFLPGFIGPKHFGADRVSISQGKGIKGSESGDMVMLLEGTIVCYRLW